MQYQSVIQQRGPVAMPQFMGDRIYMLPFMKADGLPAVAERWQPTVDAMLDGIDTDQPLYLMVDEREVKAGEHHRRPGVHIDGYWNPGVYAHGQEPIPPAHRSSHLPQPSRGHVSASGRYSQHVSASRWDHGDWAHAAFDAPEAILLASNIGASCGYAGAWSGPVGDGGGSAHVCLDGLTRVDFANNLCYAGNVTALHESLPVQHDCLRQLVRLNVPGWTPQA